MEKMDLTTTDLIKNNIDKIAELFPSAVTEMRDENGKLKKGINFEVLKQLLSPDVVDGEERYEFTWVGKKAAMAEAARPITKTLRPVKEDSRNWDTTENLYLEGDNLEVLKILQESYLGKVKMIYIDPPYNTGKDFIYKDRYYISSEEYSETQNSINEYKDKLFVNSENSGKYHSYWCSMLFSRLKIARELLNESGVIFISIDDHEVDSLKKICNEVFGEYNYVGCAGRITKKSNNKGDFWAPNFDYLLTYTKCREYAEGFTGGVNESAYNLIENSGPRKGERYQLVRLYMSSIQNRNPEQRYWIECPDGSKIIPPGDTFPPERPNLGDGIWRWTKKTFDQNKDKIVIKRVRSSNLLNENHEKADWNVYTKTYLKDVIENSTAKPNSFIEEHINQIASHELSSLKIPFDYAKPTTLLTFLMKIAKVNSEDLVLDFFSGSATTAHAVMQLNAEDGGHRKFIMVQLPEPCGEKTEAYKAGYKNICEIGKERIRRAGDKIKSEHSDADLDIGFRVFRVDESNMKDVYYHPEEVQQQDLFDQVSNIKEDSTDMDLLYACLLDWGVEIHLPHTQEVVDGCTVHDVDGGALMACFDEKVPVAVVEHMAKKQPLRVVFRDSAFASDAEKINVTEIFKNLSPDTKVKVL